MYKCGRECVQEILLQRTGRFKELKEGWQTTGNFRAVIKVSNQESHKQKKSLKLTGTHSEGHLGCYIYSKNGRG